MQARDNDLEGQRLESFVTEIKNLIADNNLELATKRLGYFAEDFAIDKKRKYETVVKKATDDPKSSKLKTYLKRLEDTATSLGKIATPILTIATGISTLL